MTTHQIAWNVGFDGRLVGCREVAAGSTLSELLGSVDERVRHLIRSIQINGQDVPEVMWDKVRPKASGNVPIAVTFHGAPTGGGNRGGAKTLVLGAVLIATGMWMNPGLLAKTIFQVGVSMALSGAAAMLTNAPSSQIDGGDFGGKDVNASLQGNTADKNSYLPYVAGIHRVHPPFIQPSLVEIVNDDEFVTAVYGLAGPHSFGLPDIYVGDVQLGNTEDIEVEWRNGQGSDTPITFVTKQSFTDSTGTELSSHTLTTVAAFNPRDLDNQIDPAASSPIWHSFTTRKEPDEFWMQLYFQRGLFFVEDTKLRVLTPIRVRFKARGAATWINAPEVIYCNSKTNNVKATVKFIWTNGSTPRYSASNSLGFCEAYTRTSRSYWVADNYFEGSPNPASYQYFSGRTGTVSGNPLNIHLYYDRVEIYLDEAVFPKGEYEFQVMQGQVIQSTNDDYYPTIDPVGSWPAVTTVSNSYDPFLYINEAGVYRTQSELKKFQYVATVGRSISVWDEHPTPIVGDAAYVAIKAKNRQVGPISIITGATVRTTPTVVNTLTLRSTDPTRASRGVYNFTDSSGREFVAFPKTTTGGVELFETSTGAVLNTGDPSNPFRPFSSLQGISGLALDGNKVYGFSETTGQWLSADAYANLGTAVVGLGPSPAWNFAINTRYGVLAGGPSDVRQILPGSSTHFPTNAPAAAWRAGVETRSGNIIVVGDGGSLARGRAENGVGVWTTLTSGTPVNLRSVAADGTTVVAVGDSGVILHSLNSGQSFTAVPSGSNSRLNSVTYVPGFNVWVAVSFTGQILVSPDGSTWAVSAVSASPAQLWSVHYSTTSGQLVLGGNGGRIATLNITEPPRAVSQNPADHFRQFLDGDVLNQKLPLSLLDTATIAAWKAHCTAKNLTVNGVIQNQSNLQALQSIAACGFGQPYMSEIWGVVYERDRSAEPPTQVFTPLNSAGFSYSKALPKLTDTIRTNFYDAQSLYRQQELLVDHFSPGGDALVEQVDYWGLTTEAQVSARAVYDMTILRERGGIYVLNSDIENIVCRRGDLVAVLTDVLDSTAGYARIKSVTLAAGNVTGLVLDATVTVGTGPNAVAIRFDSGAISVHQVNQVSVDTNVLTFTTPFPDNGFIIEGSLAAVGQSSKVYKRLIVASITPGADLTARITLFDEAPALVALI